MSAFEPPPGEVEELKPSWLHNGFLALGCLILAGAMFGLDPETNKGAIYMGAFLIFSALVILATHLPGATGVWIDRDGFLVREMYKTDRYSWDEVGPFITRRKLLGKAIEFPYAPADGGNVQARSLPRGLTGSVFSVAKKMNDWRAWATEQDA